MDTNSGEIGRENHVKYDRLSQLKAFDESKTGVKGLVEAGVSKIPRIFIDKRLVDDDNRPVCAETNKLSIPIISFEGVDESATMRKKAVERIREESEKWGFFQVVNHGISYEVLYGIIDAVRRFHEPEPVVRKRYYARDQDSEKFVYNTNFDLYRASTANWRDTIGCLMLPNPPSPEDLPEVCRYLVYICIPKKKKKIIIHTLHS